jgi:hypothetical protein
LHRRLGRKTACGRPEKLALLLSALRPSKRRLASALLIACNNALRSLPVSC